MTRADPFIRVSPITLGGHRDPSLHREGRLAWEVLSSVKLASSWFKYPGEREGQRPSPSHEMRAASARSLH